MMTPHLKKYLQVIVAGGLHVVGTERHESRRIDNQVGTCDQRKQVYIIIWIL